MTEQKFEDLIYAYSAGCLDKDELIELVTLLQSNEKVNDRKLGDLQNVLSLLPLVLEIEKPNPQVRDKFARRLFRLRDEARVKAKFKQPGTSQTVFEAPKENIVPELPVENELPKEIITEVKVQQPEPEKPKAPEVKIPEVKVVDAILEAQKSNEKLNEVKQEKIQKKEEKPVTAEIKKQEKEQSVKDSKADKKEPVKESKKEDKKDDLKEQPGRYRGRRGLSYVEEEEKKGLPKAVIIGVVALVLAGAAYFFTKGSSESEVAQNKPQTQVQEVVSAEKQREIDSINQAIATIQNQQQQNVTAATGTTNEDLALLMKELQAVKDELAKQQAQAKTQQTQTAAQPEKTVAEPVKQPEAASAAARQVVTQAVPAAKEPEKEEPKPAAVSKPAEPEYYSVVDEIPTPVGGAMAIQKKVSLPEKAITANVQGKVFVQAFIDETGNVVRTTVMKGIGYGCDEVAEFAVKSTKFKPGRVKGANVKSQTVIPVQFKL